MTMYQRRKMMKVKDFIECELDVIRKIEFIFDFDREDQQMEKLIP